MNRHSAFADAVTALNEEDFELLRRAVDERCCREKHGLGTLAEAADLYRTDPARPSCRAASPFRDGRTAGGVQRWRCRGSVEKVGVAHDSKRADRRPGTWNTVDILCRLDPARKLEAGFDHLPGLRLQPRPVERPVDPARAALVVEPHHLRLREVPGLLPCLVLLAHDRAGQPHQRRRRWEHLHHPRPALYLAVRPLLDVVGVQALPVRRRKFEECQGVRLGLLEDRRRPRAAPLQHVARHGGGIAPAEHLRDDPAHAAPELSGARLAHAAVVAADGPDDGHRGHAAPRRHLT